MLPFLMKPPFDDDDDGDDDDDDDDMSILPVRSPTTRQHPCASRLDERGEERRQEERRGEKIR